MGKFAENVNLGKRVLLPADNHIKVSSQIDLVLWNWLMAYTF